MHAPECLHPSTVPPPLQSLRLQLAQALGAGVGVACTGVDGEPEWHRFALVKEQMEKLGLATEAASIEAEMKEKAQRLWNERLQTQFAK